MNTTGSSKALKGIIAVLAVAIVVLGGLVLMKNLSGGGELENPNQPQYSNAENLRNSPDVVPDTTVAPKGDDASSSESAA